MRRLAALPSLKHEQGRQHARCQKDEDGDEEAKDPNLHAVATAGNCVPKPCDALVRRRRRKDKRQDATDQKPVRLRTEIEPTSLSPKNDALPNHHIFFCTPMELVPL